MKSTLLIVAAVLCFRPSFAAVIYVTTNDSFAKIEAAQPGDEVVIAPGTYHFRVHLKAKAPAERPIAIRAQNVKRKPVWDFDGSLVEDAPGSHRSGDRGRGGWQIDGGANYHISGIEFAHCRTADMNSAGLRYYNGATGIVLKGCYFHDNDNGLTGGNGNSEILVESCEFANNGNSAATNTGPTHNLYIYGGAFTMRYCYVHDSAQSENFHIRARIAMLEYNWFARGKSYEGDLMSDADFRGSGPFSQTMILRGNVFIQNKDPENHSFVLAVLNDSRVPNDSFSLQAINNTFIGNGGRAAFIHLVNSDGTRMSAQLFNNIISGTTVPVRVDRAERATVTGGNNWLANGVNPGPLTNSVFSSSPGFKNPSAKDFTLASDSACIGRANQSISGLPTQEIYRDEHRARVSAKDIGAFESR